MILWLLHRWSNQGNNGIFLIWSISSEEPAIAVGKYFNLNICVAASSPPTVQKNANQKTRAITSLDVQMMLSLIKKKQSLHIMKILVTESWVWEILEIPVSWTPDCNAVRTFSNSLSILFLENTWKILTRKILWEPKDSCLLSTRKWLKAYGTALKVLSLQLSSKEP